MTQSTSSSVEHGVGSVTACMAANGSGMPTFLGVFTADKANNLKYTKQSKSLSGQRGGNTLFSTQ